MTGGGLSRADRAQRAIGGMSTSAGRALNGLHPWLTPREWQALMHALLGNARRGKGVIRYLPGDWECGECGSHNFARRQECFQCSTPWQGDEVGLSEGIPTEGGDRSGSRHRRGRSDSRFWSGARRSRSRSRGRWGRPAQATGAEGYGSRIVGEERPTWGEEPEEGSNTLPQPSMRGKWRDGDWECVWCQAHNYSRRTDCYNCTSSRPLAERDEAGGRDAFGRASHAYFGSPPALRGRGGGTFLWRRTATTSLGDAAWRRRKRGCRGSRSVC